MKKKQRTRDKAFKERAVKLYLNGGKSQKEIAEDPGMDRSLLSRWRREYGKKNAFPGQDRSLRFVARPRVRGNPRDEKMRDSRKENRDLREERDILKKAPAVF